jgi:hypothetical protein
MDGSGEGWTWGLDWATKRPGDQSWWLTSETSTSASAHGSDRVDRVKTEDVQVEWGLEDLAADRSRTAVTRVGRQETRMEYATREQVWWFRPQNHRWRVYGFGPQNPGEGFEKERTACGILREFASRWSYWWGGTVAVGWRWHRVRP